MIVKLRQGLYWINLNEPAARRFYTGFRRNLSRADDLFAQGLLTRKDAYAFGRLNIRLLKLGFDLYAIDVPLAMGFVTCYLRETYAIGSRIDAGELSKAKSQVAKGFIDRTAADYARIIGEQIELYDTMQDQLCKLGDVLKLYDTLLQEYRHRKADADIEHLLATTE